MAELAGYMAAGLVFATFYMRTMIPLRVVGIASNIAFLIYSSLADLLPVLILHCALLPLNLWRLGQIRTMVRQVRHAARGELPLDSLLPFMASRRLEAGAVLFRRDDVAHEMFYLVSGTIRLNELGKVLGPGSMLGEISLFAPGRARTATAICESDVELLAITAEKVMQLYYQNPTFGFQVVQLITSRLIENAATLPGTRAAEHATVALTSRPAGAAGAGVSARELAGRMHRGVLLRRLGWAIGLTGILAFGGWHLAPYLRSVIARDAAITTWIHVATSPIRGSVDALLTLPGQRTGADGRIATLHNRHIDDGLAQRSAAEAAGADAAASDLATNLAGLRELDAEWKARTLEHAATFRRKLELVLTSGRVELDLVARRLALARSAVERMQRLSQRGNASQADSEEAQAFVVELELLRAERERVIAEAEIRREATERGIFLTEDGGDPDWADRSRDALRLEIARATASLAEARAALAKARRLAAVDAAILARVSSAAVAVPPGSLIWSVVVGAGATVEVGNPIAEWLNCGVMLVDVPVSEIKAALLHAGMRADVLMEGETEPRSGIVLLTRGAAATLGPTDLAAIARGRSAGVGQALLTLEAGSADMARCPIGLAASVDFPDLDAIDLLQAWLRL